VADRAGRPRLVILPDQQRWAEAGRASATDAEADELPTPRRAVG
jgi:hypothetical protein